VPRRVHVEAISPGEIRLSDREAHHVRDVLRLTSGQAVALFDDAGNTADAELLVSADSVIARVNCVRSPRQRGPRIIVASAIPKTTRADWLIEKLSELGVDTFVPLATARSVVVPEGKNKFDRWNRLAAESAKQSNRNGVMKIEPLTRVDQAMQTATSDGPGWHLSTDMSSPRITRRLSELDAAKSVTLFIGPEGDWSPGEVARFKDLDIRPTGLTRTILRVETAAVTATAVVASYLASI
jgi:16S rRNA (uracil1498-N3)-methyltransferase